MSIYTDLWNKPCIEPIKRKHGSYHAEWQSHRFSIKGGITWRQAMIIDFSARNVLLAGMTFRDITIRIEDVQPRR